MWPDDQIVFSIFGHLQQWNLPESIQIVTTRVKNFAQTQINLKYIAKYFYIFAKAVEFRQIWSHWRRTSLECLVFQNRPIIFLSFKSNTFSLDGLPVSMHRKVREEAAIAQWIRLDLSSCGPRFKSRVYHRPTLFYLESYVILYLSLGGEKNENKQKSCPVWPLFKDDSFA